MNEHGNRHGRSTCIYDSTHSAQERIREVLTETKQLNQEAKHEYEIDNKKGVRQGVKKKYSGQKNIKWK